MNKKIILVLIGMALFTGCWKKTPLPTIDSNTTKEQNTSVVIEEQNISIIPLEENISIVPIPIPVPVPPVIMEEEEKDVFTWKQNDEVFMEGVASKIVVVKSKRVAVLFDADDNMLSRHRISLGEHPIGAKRKKGDKKTPEGVYRILDIRRDPKYYKEILISYPNREDIEASRALGVNPGGGITFHAQVPWNWDGHGDDYTLSHDWTIGCMAMTNKGMDNVWSSVNKDTIVEIRE